MEPCNAMNEFVESLKESYREGLLSCEEQWPPVRGDNLINLQLVETDKTEGFSQPIGKSKYTPISRDDLFKPDVESKKPVKKLIVEGNAGIGKTTLCTMLAEEWAENKILTQFDCVLLLPLRDQLVTSATSLEDLLCLYHPDESICSSVVRQLKRKRGKSVLIIADGWDELSEEQRSKQSFIYNLLFGRLLPSVSVLLTSRPSASAPLHNLPCINRLVEVVGFNEENIKQYVESEFKRFPKKASSLVEQLESNSLIQCICSVPLTCAIVCHLWHTLDSALPSTCTELYVLIVLNVILRDIKKSNLSSSWCSTSVSFDSIPGYLQKTFWSICKFAYECLSQDQIVFSEDKLASFFPEFSDSNGVFLSFGLLQYTHSLLPVGQGLSFRFAHLTIQEFLAALHLVTLSNKEKLKICDTHVNSRFDVVWRFVFGLSCKREVRYSQKVICLNDEVVARFVSTANSMVLLCHCSMESLNNTVHTTIAKQISGKFLGHGGRAKTPQDCVAIFHVLCNTVKCSNVRIQLASCGLSDKLLKELTDVLSSASGDLQVRQLSLRNNKLTGNGITDLFERASDSFSTLESLKLSGNSITSIEPLFSLGKKLEYLDLSDNPLAVSGIQSLETAVQSGTLVTLWYLSLSNTLTDDADVNGALLTTLSSTIASHCPRLSCLNLSKNYLGVPGVYALREIFTVLTSNRIRLRLNVRDTRISYKCLAVLSDIVGSTPRESSCECELNLSKNPLKYDGLLAIIEMLKKESCPITELDLSSADLTTPVEKELHPNSVDNRFILGSAIESSKLESLYLQNNNFSGDKVYLLAECLRVCPSLKHLYSWRCSLTSSGASIILDHLKSSDCIHQNLKVWDLSYNFFEDEGATLLIQSIPELFPSLENVQLRDNPVSDKINERLQEVLEVNRKKRLSHEQAKRRKLAAQQKAEKVVVRRTVLTEWERTCSPSQNQELNQEFHRMWSELLEELNYLFLSLNQSNRSLTQLEMVDSDDIQASFQLSPPISSFSKNEKSVEGSLATPSDEQSFHSAREELVEPVKSHSKASEESSCPTLHSSCSSDQPKTKKFGLKTVTIEELKARTSVTDSQLDRQLQERDLFKLSAHFDNVESYLVPLGLTPSQRTDIKDLAFRRGTQSAVNEALRLWREPNPYAATYRALVEVLVDLGKGEVAVDVCTYLSSKCEISRHS